MKPLEGGCQPGVDEGFADRNICARLINMEDVGGGDSESVVEIAEDFYSKTEDPAGRGGGGGGGNEGVDGRGRGGRGRGGRAGVMVGSCVYAGV